MCAHRWRPRACRPEELARRSAARRDEATRSALARLPASKHAEFAGLVAELDGYVTVREGRAYWQMVLTGEMRGLALRTGAELVRRSLIEQPDDMLFLTADDVEGDVAPDLRTVVVERRREWERWRAVVPPAVIGAPQTPAPVVAAGAGELRGLPASRGTVTGPATILRGLEDGAGLRAGDILVCVMTTPAWTPLFAIAGGIITETGGALSHPAITAREYGIPAVVAVPDATTLVRDGQMVTVRGEIGTVTLHG